MSNANEGNEPKPDVTEKKKEGKPKKELTPQEIQKRKKMLVYPLFVLLFIGSMWLIFAPSGDKNEQQPDGFNSELPIPKDEAIVGDKRTAYEQEAMQNKQNENLPFGTVPIGIYRTSLLCSERKKTVRHRK